MISNEFNGHIDLGYSEDQIVEAIKTNDEKIIGNLVKKLMPIKHYHNCWNHKLYTAEDKEEFYAQTWMVVIVKIKENRYAKDNFVGYFSRIHRNIWLNFCRNQGRRIPVNLFDNIYGETEFDLYHQIFGDERYGFVEECLKKLSVVCQKILDLLYSKKMSYEDICNVVKLKTPGSARVRKFNCIKQLKKCVRKSMN
ncbi:sigma-70 family RNA polymerase sigma factor [Fulvivirgaceae bacterium BMA10]|uniref:Sigma-70 family RNA polymerase sigma factor n=1 Tax=Splendidivirga corallicola TaxID=3051826 RepID=A0ABT8KUR6_9BACT|nr:sigma-70 family RNA polymerase sigma factor [Fulvivirgaceae bacterium BMA10]